MDVPPDVKEILSRPGTQWTSAQKERIANWLFEPPAQEQFRAIWSTQLRHYPEVQFDDVLQGFFAGRPKSSGSPFQDVIRNYDPLGSFQGYLFVAFLNHCRKERKRADDLRREEPTTQRPVVNPDDDAMSDVLETGGPAAIRWSDDDVADHLDAAKRLARVLLCLKGLPEGYQEVILLRIMNDLSVRETARVLQKTEVSVRVTLHRALNKLRKCLKRRQGRGE